LLAGNHSGSLFKLFVDGAKKSSAKSNEAEEETYPLESVSNEETWNVDFPLLRNIDFWITHRCLCICASKQRVMAIATQTHNVLLGMTNTIILLTSSLAMILALYSIKAGT